MKERLIKLMNEHLQSVYETGQTFFYFKKNINPLLKNLGIELDNYPEEGEEDLWDSDIVYNKNLSTENLEIIYLTYGSFYYGVQRFNSMIENNNSRPFWQYDDVINPNTPSFCKSLVNKVFLFNSPFWDRFYPPNHPGCMARIRTLTKQEVENGNLQIFDGSEIVHPYPDWAFNPAKVDWKLFFDDFIIKTFAL